MVDYYKIYDELIEKFVGFGQKAESLGGNWRDNIKNIFEDAKRYHFSCKLGDRDDLYFHYYTSRNENNLVSFTLWKENGSFKCNSVFGFPLGYSEDKKNDVTYDICRDCVDDLERLEEAIVN